MDARGRCEAPRSGDLLPRQDCWNDWSKPPEAPPPLQAQAAEALRYIQALADRAWLRSSRRPYEHRRVLKVLLFATSSSDASSQDLRAHIRREPPGARRPKDRRRV